MKTLLTISTRCIILCMLFSSCNSSLLVTKRHYTGGYYVEHTKRVKTINPAREEKTAQASTTFPSHSLSYRANPAIINEDYNQVPEIEYSVNTSTRERRPHKPVTSSNVKQTFEQSTNISKAIEVQSNPIISEVNASSGHGGGGDKSAISLLLIVIIVILILWLIGILAGASGLINLLLVIALILLILWLLKII